MINQTLLSRVVRAEGLTADDGRAVWAAILGGKAPADSTRQKRPNRREGQGAATITTLLPSKSIGRAMVGMVKRRFGAGTA